MKRFIVCFIASVLVLSLFSGCRLSHYEEDEIAAWAKENFDEPVKISSEYFERPTGEGNYTDRVWNAYLESNPDLKFEIISHEHYGMESISHSMETTYDYVYGRYYFDLYCKENKTDFVPLYDEAVYSDYELYVKFADRYELADVIDQAEDITDYMEKAGIEECVDFQFEYDDSLICAQNSDVFEYADCDSSFDEVESTLLRELIIYSADHRTGLEQFTEEEITDTLRSSDERFMITRTDYSTTIYPDLALSRFGHGISFGCLYEVLSREGFAVYGTPSHFSFVGIDGSFYEFSYDFNDMPYEDDKVGYYYLKDGEKTAMKAYFYTHFRKDFLEEISGLTFDEVDGTKNAS